LAAQSHTSVLTKAKQLGVFKHADIESIARTWPKVSEVESDKIWAALKATKYNKSTGGKTVLTSLWPVPRLQKGQHENTHLHPIFLEVMTVLHKFLDPDGLLLLPKARTLTEDGICDFLTTAGSSRIGAAGRIDEIKRLFTEKNNRVDLGELVSYSTAVHNNRARGGDVFLSLCDLDSIHLGQSSGPSIRMSGRMEFLRQTWDKTPSLGFKYLCRQVKATLAQLDKVKVRPYTFVVLEKLESARTNIFKAQCTQWPKHTVLVKQFRGVSAKKRCAMEVQAYGKLKIPRVLELLHSSKRSMVLWPCGVSLANLSPQPKPLLLKYAKQVLSTVFEARTVGLVHEDIKPDNIITYQGDAYLIDWEITGSLFFFFFFSLFFLVPFLSSLFFL
jgi:hypothetical protein